MVYSIPDFYRPALQRLAGMTEQEFSRFFQALQKSQPHLKPEVFSRAVATAAEEPLTNVEDMMDLLHGLSSTRASADVSVDEFVRDISAAMERESTKTGQPFDRGGFEKRLMGLLNADSMQLSARAHDVQHEYENVFDSARILTDIRPLFTPPATEVIGLMIMHNLKITYYHQGEYGEIYIAMDDADLITFKNVLERATTKTVVLERAISQTGLPYLESK